MSVSSRPLPVTPAERPGPKLPPVVKPATRPNAEQIGGLNLTALPPLRLNRPFKNSTTTITPRIWPTVGPQRSATSAMPGPVARSAVRSTGAKSLTMVLKSSSWSRFLSQPTIDFTVFTRSSLLKPGTFSSERS